MLHGDFLLHTAKKERLKLLLCESFRRRWVSGWEPQNTREDEEQPSLLPPTEDLYLRHNLGTVTRGDDVQSTRNMLSLFI